MMKKSRLVTSCMLLILKRRQKFLQQVKYVGMSISFYPVAYEPITTTKTSMSIRQCLPRQDGGPEISKALSVRHHPNTSWNALKTQR